MNNDGIGLDAAYKRLIDIAYEMATRDATLPAAAVDA
jgi:hypothetical protein